MVAVTKALSEGLRSYHFGTLCNFHHAHESINEFNRLLETKLPYLICLNLNGVTDAASVRANPEKNKILPIGSGKFARRIIQFVLNSGYKSRIGILEYIAKQDAKISLQENTDGLPRLLSELERDSGPKREPCKHLSSRAKNHSLNEYGLVSRNSKLLTFFDIRN
jgi:hypothetical protein